MPTDRIRTPEAEKSDDKEPFDQLAITIAQVDVPLTARRNPSELLPSEKPNTPDRWIDNYAQGMADSGNITYEDAAKGIRTAFESRYGVGPEIYAERYYARHQERPAKEVQEILSSAAKALDELALQRPLSPDAEEAREHCHDALEKMEQPRPDKSFEKSIHEAARQETVRRHDREEDRDR